MINKIKKIVYVDLDGVLCNFRKAHQEALLKNPLQPFPQSQWGFFLYLEEIPGAIEAFKKLQEKYDVWILTKPSFYNVNCFTEKAQWVLDHLGFNVLEKTIMSGDKSLLKGDYLIDDMNTDKQSDFEGEWIEFGSYRFPDWNSIISYLI
jgi:5'(3')-deoxyribonucleotidase